MRAGARVSEFRFQNTLVRAERRRPPASAPVSAARTRASEAPWTVAPDRSLKPDALVLSSHACLWATV